MKIGDKLSNGAIVIATKHDLVLALWAENTVTPYVTWRVDRDGSLYMGHYHQEIAVAVADYEERGPISFAKWTSR